MALDFVSPSWRQNFCVALWFVVLLCTHVFNVSYCSFQRSFGLYNTKIVLLLLLLLILIGSVTQFHILLIRISGIRKSWKTQVLNLYMFEIWLNVFLRNIMCYNMDSPYISDLFYLPVCYYSVKISCNYTAIQFIVFMYRT